MAKCPMTMKTAEREQALALRRAGVSYTRIMSECRIAKSTLWHWLRAAGMVETNPQRMTELKRMAQQKAASVVRSRRLARTQAIMQAARREVGPVSSRDLWLLGVAMYWAEGAKQKPWNVSASVIFSNSDPAAVRLFVRWVAECCGVAESWLTFELFLHETADGQRALDYWRQALGLSADRLFRIRWKRHRPVTRRMNVGDSYHGLIRVRVARSTALNRRIAGWVLGVSEALGSGVMVTRLTLDQKTPGSNPGSPAIRPSQDPGTDDRGSEMTLLREAPQREYTASRNVQLGGSRGRSQGFDHTWPLEPSNSLMTKECKN